MSSRWYPFRRPCECTALDAGVDCPVHPRCPACSHPLTGSAVDNERDALADRVAELERELEVWRTCFKFPDGETEFALKRARFWLGKGESIAQGRPYPRAIEPDFEAVAEDRASEFAQAVIALSAEVKRITAFGERVLLKNLAAELARQAAEVKP